MSCREGYMRADPMALDDLVESLGRATESRKRFVDECKKGCMMASHLGVTGSSVMGDPFCLAACEKGDLRTAMRVVQEGYNMSHPYNLYPYVLFRNLRWA